MSEQELRSSNSIVNVIVVIDTDALVEAYNGKNPSQDPNSPTGINHSYAYMVVTSQQVIGGSGTADLNFKANVGDVIRWTGTSESNNFDASVLIYGLPQFGGGTQVFSNPTFKMYTRSSMLPAQNTIFPVTYSNQTYWFIQADISNTGTENYCIQFGLYYRPSGGDQQLLGYFYWDPAITISN
ncbi:inclusion body family protein [Serratia entomophila]|uniref:inclusion body family protein n=1 Tax=Serratia entomophila TaxID=42906 RepID=UPI00217B939F|nr:inclusion body family protein [Serratia entomophila]CAI0890833.1 Inclusion body protein [Serratia entomophila]CAI1528273.1 Inclusion body protein [Serratia entomophila]CAI1578049.1 Inclusion body protein [Serratia entomophila]CAI1584488.1 Inclusion body protein [Serratia entomophila]CAI1607361.1 Inclusion body protein [Serratia entomophila]